MRESKVLGALAARTRAPTGATAEELVPGAYDDVPVLTWPIALLSLRAHLEKLVPAGARPRRGEATGRATLWRS